MQKGRHPRTNHYMGHPERVYAPLAEENKKWEAAAGMRALQRAIMQRAQKTKEESVEILAPDAIEEEADTMLEEAVCELCDEEVDETLFREDPQDEEEWGDEQADFFGLND